MRDGTTNPDRYPSTVAQAREYFTILGFDTVPLLPASKRTGIRGWQLRSPRQLWEGAAPESNIGIRGAGSGRLAVLDFDDKSNAGTSERGLRWLAGLGLRAGDYPLVQTASGVGRHVYIRLEGAFSGNSSIFKPVFGAGELRYGPGAYVVAPPSTVGGRRYCLLSGSYRHLPTLAMRDIIPLLRTAPAARAVDRLYAAGLLLRIPPRTFELLRGIGLERYATRSEAEQAIVTSLVRAGFGFNAITEAFEIYPCAGRFREECAKSPKRGLAWLRRGYEKAAFLLQNSVVPARHQAQEAEEWAQSRRWSGRTG